MLHDNNTPLAAIGFEQWHPNGATMAVAAARARLTLDEAGQPIYAPDQKLVLADTYAGDPHRVSMSALNDLVPFRPAADVTVNGKFQAADPAPWLRAGVKVGERALILKASGPRFWHHSNGWKLSNPEPILEVPVCYTLASGGRLIGHPDGDVDPRNPIGTGVIHADFTPKSIKIPAPRILLDGTDLPHNPLQVPAPEGFGAISPWWQGRACHAGTYDAQWVEHVHPRLPKNFDYRFYQAAHPRMIQLGYLFPGTPVQTFGLWSGGRSVNFTIPDIVPVARYSFTDGREVQVRLHMDGLHLDLTGPQPAYDLTWRCWIETCPALYRIDLDVMRWHEAMELRLPVSCLDGLMESAG